MSVTDPIADALTIVRNASSAKRESAQVKASKIIGQIFEILKKERFIQDFRFVGEKTETSQGFYKVYLKYQKGNVPAISGIKKISLPGRRRYIKKDDIPMVYGGLGISILSTPKGILNDKDAREVNVGGELICQVW